jgi:hypothetical protein
MNHKLFISLTLLLAAFSILGTYCFGQKTFLNIEASTLATLPISASKDESILSHKLKPGAGIGLGISASRHLNNGFWLTGGVQLSKMTIREKVSGLRFGSDILNGTETAFQRNIKLNEVGIFSLLERFFPLSKMQISSILGVGYSRFFGHENWKHISGTESSFFEKDFIEAGKKGSSFNLHIGTGVHWPLPNNRSIGLRPMLTLRLGKIENESVLVTNAIRPHSIAVCIYVRNLLGSSQSKSPSNQ